MRFRSLSFATAIGLMSVQACTPPAAPATGTPADEAAIRAVASKYAEGFAKKDAKAMAALVTVDYEDQDAMGRHTQGRDAFEKQMASDFSQMPDGMTLTVGTTFVKWLSNTAAVAGGTYQGQPALPGTTGKGAWLAVLVKKDSTWLMASALGSNEPPAPAPAMPAKKKP